MRGARVGERQQVSGSNSTAPRQDSPTRAIITAVLRLRRQRRKKTGSSAEGRQRLVPVAALVVVASATAIVVVNVVSHGSAAGPSTRPAQAGAPRGTASHSPSAATQSETVALVRAQAAAWIARQLSPSAIMACDPQMCLALRAVGLRRSRLLVLHRPTSDPLGAEIVVATLAVRNQFGPRLANVYAPEVIASFGSGPARIEVRYSAPGGARAFQASQAADHDARVAAGQQLLRNQRIHTSKAARTALAAGSVDPRLLVTIAALAAQSASAPQQVSVVAFGDSSPGAAGVPLRDAEIGSGSRASVQAMLSFLLAQQPPYRPAKARLVRQPDGRYVVNVQFDAPSPLGLSGGP